MEINYEISGTIFSTLTIEDLKASPIEPGPVERLEVGLLRLQYSLWDLIRDGFPAFLELVEIRDAMVVLNPVEQPPEVASGEKKQSGKFPALIPETLILDNIHIEITDPSGQGNEVLIDGLHFALYPDRPGELKIPRLRVPALGSQENIQAATSFQNRNLVLKDFVFGNLARLETFSLDMSQLTEDLLVVGWQGRLLDAPTEGTLEIRDLNESNTLTARVSLQGLEISSFEKIPAIEIPGDGQLSSAEVTFHGVVSEPSSWAGNVSAEISSLSMNGSPMLSSDLNIKFANAEADLLLTISGPANGRVEATTTLPDSFEIFSTSKGNGTWNLEVSLDDLPGLTGTSGVVTTEASFQWSDQWLKSSGRLKSGKITSKGLSVSGTSVTWQAGLPLQTESLLQDAEVGVTLAVGDLVYSGYAISTVQLKATLQEGRITLEESVLERGTNQLSLSAEIDVPESGEAWEKQPVQFQFSLNAPQLSELVVGENADNVSGVLTARGQGRIVWPEVTGEFQMDASEIAYGELSVESATASLVARGDSVQLEELSLKMGENNTLSASGQIGLTGEYAYQGRAQLNFENLGVFQPVVPEPLSGTLTGQWSGEGRVNPPSHKGSLSAKLNEARYGPWENLSLNLAGDYSPEQFRIAPLAFTSDWLDLEGSVRWDGQRLQVPLLTAMQNENVLATLSADLPFRLEELSAPTKGISTNQPLTISLKVPRLELGKLEIPDAAGAANPVPLKGFVQANAQLDGTLEDLAGRVEVSGENLLSPAAGKVPPTDIELSARLENNAVDMEGTVTNRWIEPLTLSANAPLPVDRLMNGQGYPQDAPLRAQVRLPESRLDFLTSLIPDLRQVRGTAMVNVDIGGTLGAPDLDGVIRSTVQTLRFRDATLPSLNDTNLRIAFDGDSANIEALAGKLGGGSFSVGGSVGFENPAKPVLDLTFESRNALVVQNDDLSVRINSDLSLEGPLDSVDVTGSLGITRGRFFKNIEILPLGLPGRPAPQPAPDPGTIGFSDPPLRDWTFDVAIGTEDPFLVQSNLATGKITADLRLGGTGQTPWLDGAVQVENLVASLPFSRLTFENGQILFARQNPFTAQLNLLGTSVIRDYEVRVYITGTADDPEVIFSSNPPLPQGEIVSLLATGMTTDDLENNPGALAGQAAVLAFRRLYRSVFARGKPEPKEDTFLNRIQLDVGSTDPRTGRQASSIRIPLTENIVLSGGLDIGGNFTGQVRYLIRFR